MERVWSEYSKGIFDAYMSSKVNLLVKACPGAGKTTNIEHLWGMDDKPTAYLVFNKHNEVEAKGKLPNKEGSGIHTLNGLGAKCIYATFGKVVLNDKKVIEIIRKVKSKLDREYQYTLSKVVAVAKCIDTGVGLSEDMYEEMLRMHDIDEYGGMYGDVLNILERSDADTKVIDFADQLRFPVIYDCVMPEYRNVLCDEVQDFNPVQAELIAKLHAERYVLVGDEHQSIYGFRGAMNNSMSILSKQFECKELPLSITYRCAKDIVKEARGVYADIESWDMSPQGVVRYSSAEKEGYNQEDIVLCRMNRPLVQLAYQLLQGGIPCHVRGRDIGTGLIKLIEKQGAFTVRELIGYLNDECAVEMEKARVKEDEEKMQRIEDKYSSALLFCQKCKLEDSPSRVIESINTLFEQGRGVCLSTVHKAKGLEAERAMLLSSDMFSSFATKAKQQWQKEQERNVLYVAITRAKAELIYM